VQNYSIIADINLCEPNSIIGETMEQIPNNLQASVIAYDQNYFGDKFEEGSNYNPQVGCSEWGVNATFGTTALMNGIPYSFSDSQSDSEITPSVDGATRWN